MTSNAFIALPSMMALACGGTVVTPVDGGTDSNAFVDASVDGGPCRTVSGAHGCGGPNNCTWSDKVCGGCLPDSFHRTGAFSVCGNDILEAGAFVFCQDGCRDGDICANLTADPKPQYECAREDVGPLFASNGASDRLLYADWSSWSGQPLPTRDVCPGAAGYSLCGGPCPTCGPAQTCTGRSPTHPFSLCIPRPHGYCTKSMPSCANGQSCFLWNTGPRSDDAGYCMPTSECQAAAAGIPGGGLCVP